MEQLMNLGLRLFRNQECDVKKNILRLIIGNESQTKLWFYIGINLDYGIDILPGINLTPGINIANGKFGKKNKRSTLNKRK